MISSSRRCGRCRRTATSTPPGSAPRCSLITTSSTSAGTTLRITAHTIEVYYRGQAVARHARGSGSRRFITEAGHRPDRHSAVIELSHERLLERAEAIGPATATVLREQTARRVHPEEALRASLGILRLAHDFSTGALEQACKRALELRTYSYRAVRTLIITPAPPTSTSTPIPAHDNVRGARYFT